VAGIDTGHFLRHLDRKRCPLPDHWCEAEVWVPKFFETLSARFADDADYETLLVASTAYLDSVDDHMDGAYLKAQVGLEALAQKILTGGDRPSIVKDEEAWRAWVKSLRTTIESHLSDATAINGVMTKFSDARFEATGSLVKRAFEHFKIGLPKDVLREVGKRNKVAHTFEMEAHLDPSFDATARRVEMIQTLLAALISKYIGYGGCLKGYDVDAKGVRPSPGWWPITDDGMSIAHFNAGTFPPRPIPGDD